MKYKIGDKVRIREWEDMAQEFGVDCVGHIRPPKGATIVAKMKKICGKETIIKHGPDLESYKLEIDGGFWRWPECALLPILEYVPPKKPIAYISGPITGVEDYYKKFTAAETTLIEKGYSVINPSWLDNDTRAGAAHDDYIDVCLFLVWKSDVLVLLPGWERSPGANREMGYAKGLGKKIIALEELCKTTNTDATQS